MRHENIMMKTSTRLQKGFSLVTAIFLLVVLAMLGAMMVMFFSVQQKSAALDVMGSRAYQASRTGIEWAAFNISTTAAGTGVPWPGCAAVPNPLFAANTLAGDLAPFTVTLTCASAVAWEGVNPIVIYNLTSTANFGGAAGNPEYVERVITVKMGR
jgi:MSHA biogenesis protein MshP